MKRISMIGAAALLALPAMALAQVASPTNAGPAAKPGGKKGAVQTVSGDGKPPKSDAGLAATAAAGSQASGVGVQQSSRMGVGGAAGEAGECCKPKELNLRASSVAAGPGGGPALGVSNAAADDWPKKDPPKDPKSFAGMADGSVRVSAGAVAADDPEKKDPPKDPKSMVSIQDNGLRNGAQGEPNVAPNQAQVDPH